MIKKTFVLSIALLSSVLTQADITVQLNMNVLDELIIDQEVIVTQESTRFKVDNYLIELIALPTENEAEISVAIYKASDEGQLVEGEEGSWLMISQPTIRAEWDKEAMINVVSDEKAVSVTVTAHQQ